MSEKFDDLDKLVDLLSDKVDALREDFEAKIEEYETILEEKDDKIVELEESRLDHDDEYFGLLDEQTDLIRGQGDLEDLLSRYDRLRKSDPKDPEEVDALIGRANIIIRTAREMKIEIQDMWDHYKTGLEIEEEES